MLLVHPLVPKVSEAISGDGLTGRSEVIWFPVGGVSVSNGFQYCLVVSYRRNATGCGFRALPKFPVSSLKSVNGPLSFSIRSPPSA